uniref:C-type lectin domain-containing protein n=1 Tax=Panagrolaimus davidi TaxID=227884 RepID=A0A914QVK4_9BILA
MFLNGKANKAFADVSSDTYWIGATDTIKAQTWSWMDNSSLAFNNWVKGQPQNTFDSNCGAGLMQGGKWISDNCDKEKPFICEFNTAPPTVPKPSCPESWTFYNATGFCYKVNVKSLNWNDAENECLKEGSHLISIHSYSEMLFATFLANPYSTNNCSWEAQTWIGLLTNDNNVHWKWTDGTPFDYTTWYPSEPDDPGKQNCGLMLTGLPCTGHPPGVLYNYPCHAILSNFICKRTP